MAAIVAAWQVNISSSSSSSLPSEVLELIPSEGDNVQHQHAVGIEFKAGMAYEAQLWLNNIALPLDEILASNNRFTYRPDEGKTIEELPAGESCMRVEYNSILRQDDKKTLTWCFTAF